MKREAGVISTSRRVYLIQKALRETQYYGLGGGNSSGTGGKKTKPRGRVGEGGGKDRRKACDVKDRRRAGNMIQADDDKLKAELIQQIKKSVACAVAILLEEEGVLIGGIKVGCYVNLTLDTLDIALGLNVSLTAVTYLVENIRGKDDTLAATIALTE